ncbi:hypothetical protein J4H92_06315 [Leucobacter weissii]|uniref:Uncharacterized protein n=1 Tax=Leucobacter weissii TaxID=1983706 RepID=A0A939MIJ4_9MICO|nr:hypothetical protein [Leucobacter weissii]MBO1901563.1 hypothetical protein [Leucobacter weissii]
MRPAPGAARVPRGTRAALALLVSLSLVSGLPTGAAAISEPVSSSGAIEGGEPAGAGETGAVSPANADAGEERSSRDLDEETSGQAREASAPAGVPAVDGVEETRIESEGGSGDEAPSPGIGASARSATSSEPTVAILDRDAQGAPVSRLRVYQRVAFTASGFAPGGHLTARATVSNVPDTLLEGAGQADSLDHAWQLDADGATAGDADFFVDEAALGEWTVVFSDGASERSVVFEVVAPTLAVDPATAVQGGAVDVSGEGFFPRDEEGAVLTLAIRIWQSGTTLRRVETAAGEDARDWVTLTVAADGTAAGELQLPNGTLRDGAGTGVPGSNPRLAAGVYEIRAFRSDDPQTPHRAALEVTEDEGAEPVDELGVCPDGTITYDARTENTGGAANTPYRYCAPETVVHGEDIVITGAGGYFARNGSTGSVVNFFVDAQYSGDPDTLRRVGRSVAHPITGAVLEDRSFAAVQAHADGSWQVRIPFPSSLNARADDGRSIDDRWAVGTQHSVRMLTNTLLAGDQRRFNSVDFTVVARAGDAPRLSAPNYRHHGYTSRQSGDRAVAWLQSYVGSGGPAKLTGTGWLTTTGRPSTVEVRLLDEHGDYYQRTGGGDRTRWTTATATADGDLTSWIPMPGTVGAGSYVAVELRTAPSITAGDFARSWQSSPIVVGDVPWTAPPSQGATCTAAPTRASHRLAPGMESPAANIGGTIRLTGKNWCNTVGGGSLIAIKINAGAYAHKGGASARIVNAATGRVSACQATVCKTNKTIWYVIEAEEDGSFDVEVPVPGRTNSTPAFAEGSYSFQLLTRTVAADPYYRNARLDPSRSIETAEFTVVKEGASLKNVRPGKPSAPAEALHETQDLRDSRRGGVRVAQGARSWTVTVPRARAGDWVYVNVYDGQTPRFPWRTEWYRVRGSGTVELPLKGVVLPVGTNKLSVQDRSGALLGWARVTVRSPAGSDPSDGGDRGSGSTGRVLTGGTARSAATSSVQPAHIPAPPVRAYDALTARNAGEATAVTRQGEMRVTLPQGAGWVFLYLYPESGDPIPIDWVRVGSDGRFTVELGDLPAGRYRIAIVDEDGALLGWVSVTGAAGADDSDTAAAEEAVGEIAGEQPRAAAIGGADPTLNLILVAAAVLLLAGSAAGFITLRGPLPGRPARPEPPQPS